MGSFLEVSCGRKTVGYSAEKWCFRLGQECGHCNSNLTHEKCLSLCKCYYFCHQNCFITQFEPVLTDDEVEYVCEDCKQPLNLKLQAKYRYEPTFTYSGFGKLMLSLLLAVLSVLMIIFTLASSMRTDVAFLLLYLEGLLLGLSLYMMAISLRQLLYVKAVKVKEIVPTKLEIQTSAFKDLDIETNEELTKDYLMFDSKKQRE